MACCSSYKFMEKNCPGAAYEHQSDDHCWEAVGIDYQDGSDSDNGISTRFARKRLWTVKIKDETYQTMIMIVR